MNVSDRGPQFVSTFWQQVCNCVEMDRRMSTALHPRTNGQTERVNVSIKPLLLALINHQEDDSVERLRMAKFAANNGTSETMKCTPLFTIQGTDPRMSFSNETTKERDQWRLDANQVQATMQQIHAHSPVEMRWCQLVQEEGANHGRIPALNRSEGSQVCWDTWHVRTARPTRKLDRKPLGPLMVVRQVAPYAYEPQLPLSIQIHRLQPGSLLDRVVYDPLDGQWVDPRPQVEVHGQEQYRVLCVDDSRVYRGQWKTLVCWTA